MEITNSELREKLNNGEKVVVEFWAPWCGPCKMLKPVFERVATTNTTNIQMYTMNIEEGDNKEIAIEYGVRSIPAIKTFNGSELRETSVGVVSEDRIKELVDSLVL
jgi:thioredoxin 1